MKILIADVAAEMTGALTILKQFYDIAVNCQTVEWLFIVSTPELAETNNVKIRNYRWVKTSWLHRLLFDNVCIKRIVKKETPDIVISLQNTYVKGTKYPQIIYLHQSIPFSDIKFNLLREPVLWLNKHAISRIICTSLKKADKIIVQTHWMKYAVINKLNIDGNRVHVVPPVCLDVPNFRYKDNKKNRKRLFYPAIFAGYKNHRVLFEALEILNRSNDYHLYLTGSKEEAKNSGIYRYDKDYIHFCGSLTANEMADMYSSTVLVFPSKLETYGLPLQEARKIGSFIIASDTPFSREILSSYKNARFFDSDNSAMLANIIVTLIDEEYHSSDAFKGKSIHSTKQTDDIIEILHMIGAK